MQQIFKKGKNVEWGLDSIKSLVNWMKADLNVRLQSTVRKQRVLSGLNYWKSLTYCTKEILSISQKIELWEEEKNKQKKNIHKDDFFKIKIKNMHLEYRQGEFSFRI